MLTFLVTIAMLVFTYHYERNGNPWNPAKGDTVPRLIWALSAGLAFLALDGFNPPLEALVWVMAASFGQLLVPHAYCQNMGTWPHPQNKWPSFMLPTLSQELWDKLPTPFRTLNDFVQMACVGLWRGLLVFAPMMLFYPLDQVILAIGAVTFGQPTAYVVGRFIPFRIWNNEPKSTEWGEFLIGAVWAVALYVLVRHGFSWI